MAIFFYVFSSLIILSALAVIISRNPVHSVLWLIFAFCNGAGLMVLMGAEFIAMMLIIIYVGAVAVLFLFVVMMLDIKLSELRGKLDMDMWFAFVMAVLLFADLAVIILINKKIIVPMETSAFRIVPELSNAYAVGRLLYTEFVLPFQTAGLILFVAMIASIALTFRLRPDVKRQKVKEQIKRDKGNSLVMAQADGKQGLENLDYDN